MRLAKKRFLNLIILVILLAICIFFILYFLHSQESTNAKENTSIDKNIQTTNEPKVEQKPSALAKKVTIKAYLNLGSGCQEETIDLLDGLAKEYKGQVSVEYIDFSTKKGYERTVKDGLNCAGLVINGKQTYTIKDRNGKQREVTFSHPINMQYTADGVKTVVKLLLGK